MNQKQSTKEARGNLVTDYYGVLGIQLDLPRHPRFLVRQDHRQPTKNSARY